MKKGRIGPMFSDRVYINGRIITMDGDRPEAAAFAVWRGCFRMVGSDAEVLGAAGKSAHVTDLGGKTVVPGLIETHSHLSLHAMTLMQAECRTPPNRTVADVLDRLREKAEEEGPGAWVRGWGFDDTLIEEKRHLTLGDLDAALPDNPAFVCHASGHIAYANSAALALAGVGPGTPQPEGGLLEKDDAGRPTGLLAEEPAQRLVMDHIPPLEVSRLKRAMCEGMRLFHRHGVTSIHDAAIGYYQEDRPVLDAYRELHRERRLSLRVYVTVMESAYRRYMRAGLGTGFGDERMKIGASKLFQDGSIQALTAALAEPYLNAPEERGHLLLDQEEMDSLVFLYHAMGCQVAIHANGERAIESALVALEKAESALPGRDLRHMIIHCQLASRDQIRRMKRLGVIPSYFVNHVHYWGDRHLGIFLGAERAARIDPLRTTVEEGVPFTLHSDLPVTPVDPFFSIYCAVNRVTRDGHPLGPEERITPREALAAYTTHAALCSHEEDVKGSITPGKLADFAVLSSDPLNCPPMEIKDIRVLETVVGGETVHTA